MNPKLTKSLKFAAAILVSGSISLTSVNAADTAAPTSVKKAIKLAEKNYTLENYAVAYKFFQEAEKLDSDNKSYYQFKQAQCLIYSGVDYEKSLSLLEAAYPELKDEAINHYVAFHLAKAYHLNNNLQKAEEFYKKAEEFKNAKEEKQDAYNLEIEKALESVEYASNAMKNPLDVTFYNLGNTVNSKFKDYRSASSNENSIYYTSINEDSTDIEVLGLYDEDIYYVERDKYGNFSNPKTISKKVNTKFNEASVYITENGNELYLFKGEKKLADIYKTTKDGGEFGKPNALPTTINHKKAFESGFCMDPKGNRIYFISDRKGGQGGKDIWYSDKTEDGSWGSAVNLGEGINTPFDEESPYVSADGNKLFFASKGFKGLGGYDIFVATFIGDKFVNPTNVGYPINSTANDFAYTEILNGKAAYISSDRVGGYGMFDLYAVLFNDKFDNKIPAQFIASGNIPFTFTVKENGSEVSYLVNDSDNKFALLNPNSSYTVNVVSDSMNSNYTINTPAQGDLIEYINVNEEVKRGIALNNNVTAYTFSSNLNQLDAYSSSLGTVDPLYRAALISNNPNQINDFLTEVSVNRTANLNSGKQNAFNTDTVFLSGVDSKLAEAIRNLPEDAIPGLNKSEDGRYSIKGVFSYKKAPASKTKVSLVDENGDVVAVTYTDENGAFMFNGIPYDANYVVQFDNEDISNYNYKYADVVVSDETSSRSFSLDNIKKNQFKLSGAEEVEAPVLVNNTSSTPTTTKPVQTSKPKTSNSVANATYISEVYFGFDKDVVTEEFKATIEKAIAQAKSSGKSIVLVGHTDSSGPAYYNKFLAKRRAKAVESYIANKGFTGSIESDSKGETEIKYDESTEEGQYKNRRVEIYLK